MPLLYLPMHSHNPIDFLNLLLSLPLNSLINTVKYLFTQHIVLTDPILRYHLVCHELLIEEKVHFLLTHFPPYFLQGRIANGDQLIVN
jgi:hypothetical protein